MLDTAPKPNRKLPHTLQDNNPQDIIPYRDTDKERYGKKLADSIWQQNRLGY